MFCNLWAVDWASLGAKRFKLESVGLAVNRLIQISYGPFQIGELTAGAVEEVRKGPYGPTRVQKIGTESATSSQRCDRQAKPVIKTDAWTSVEHPYVGFWTITRPPPGNAKDPTRARATNRQNVRLRSNYDLRHPLGHRRLSARKKTFGGECRQSARKMVYRGCCA